MVEVLAALIVLVRGLVESLPSIMLLVSGSAPLFTLQQIGQLLKATAWQALLLSSRLRLHRLLTLLPTSIRRHRLPPLTSLIVMAINRPYVVFLLRRATRLLMERPLTLLPPQRLQSKTPVARSLLRILEATLVGTKAIALLSLRLLSAYASTPTGLAIFLLVIREEVGIVSDVGASVGVLESL